MYEYDATSRGHLARAQALLGTGTKQSLLYAVLELRYGIEARLHEYLDGVAEEKTPWRISALGHEVKKVFDDYAKPVVVVFKHPENGTEIEVAYTPVTRSLEKIGKRLGKYLHRIKPNEASDEKFWGGLQLLIEKGVEGLVAATKGTLLGPPRVTRLKDFKFYFEKGTSPFQKQKPGTKVNLMRMEFILIEKDLKNNRIVFKPI